MIKYFCDSCKTEIKDSNYLYRVFTGGELCDSCKSIFERLFRECAELLVSYSSGDLDINMSYEWMAYFKEDFIKQAKSLKKSEES